MTQLISNNYYELGIWGFPDAQALGLRLKAQGTFTSLGPQSPSLSQGFQAEPGPHITNPYRKGIH